MGTAEGVPHRQPGPAGTAGPRRTFIERHPVLTYSTLTMAITTVGVAAAAALEGLPLDVRDSWLAALSLFAGPSVAGLLAVGLVSGGVGLRDLGVRLLRWRCSVVWYGIALLALPVLALFVLLALSLVSSSFLPELLTTEDVAGLLATGLMVGLVGGVLEELGWTGFAVPALRSRHGIVATGLLVGAMWAVWHVPVTVLSTVSASGAVAWSLLLPPLVFYFAVLPVFRVLLVWLHDRTESVLLAMLMHASLAGGTFVILLPAASAVQLSVYYLILATALWALVPVAAARPRSSGRRADHPASQPRERISVSTTR